MQLVGVSLSPFFERIVIGLDVKGALDKVEMPGIVHQFNTPEIREASGTGKIPYLVKDDGSVLIEGQIIFEYLDEVVEGAKLIPSDVEAATQAKLLARLYDMYVIRSFAPIIGSLIFGSTDEEAIKNAVSTEIPAALDLLERNIGEGSRAVGDDWTVADAALVPMMFQIQNFLPKFGIEGLGDRPKLNAWWNNVSDTDVVKRSHARIQAVLEAFMARQG